jgi:hypothetical protein
VLAANEYEQASTIAPWVSGYYSDLCTIYEKAGLYIEAKKDCQLFLIAVQGQAESVEVKRRIAGLDFAIDKYSEHSLGADLSAPFDRTALAEFPPGTRYFCEAFWSESGGSRGPRSEYWVVLSGTTVTGVKLAYSTADLLTRTLEGWLAGYPDSLNGYPKHYPENPEVDVRNTQRLGNRVYELTYPYVLNHPDTANDYYIIENDGTKVTRVHVGFVGERQNDCVRQ